jgi:hypothetical protein
VPKSGTSDTGKHYISSYGFSNVADGNALFIAKEMERNYEVRKQYTKLPGYTNQIQEAIHCLNSRKASPKPNLDDMRGSDDMVKWLELLGHSVQGLRYSMI